MKPRLHQPLESGDDLRRLEAKLARSRAAFSKLVRSWLILAVLAIPFAVLVNDPEGSLVPMIVLLATGALTAVRAARVLAAHPRLLAAQRRLLDQRRREPAGRSDAELRREIRQALERLRAEIGRRTPAPPPIAEALERAGDEVEKLWNALDRELVRCARNDLAPADGGEARGSCQTRVESLRARLQAFRLALVNLEMGALLDPDVLAREVAGGLASARRLLLEETAGGSGEAPGAASAASLAEAPEARRAVDPEAHHLYLKGRFFWNKRTPGEVEKSVELFRQAIARDPGYALAHAGMADAWNVLGYYGQLPPSEAFPRARGAARQALELDPDLAEAHCSLAFTKLLHDWDWPGAEASFLRSFELDPDYATAHHWYAEYLAFRERHDEAIVEARRAVALDPLSRILRTILAWAQFYARRYDEAIAELEEALALDSSFAPAELWLGLAYEQTGELERGLEILERAADDGGPSPMARAALGRLYAALGREVASLQVLEGLLEDARARYVPAYHLATLYGGRGELEKSLDTLEGALEARDNWLVFLRIDPVWDDLRSEARFEKLIRAVGLAD